MTNLDNYKLVLKDEINSSEVLALRRAVGWAEGDTEDGWLSNIKGCIQAVGLREKSSNNLVGVGFIVGNRRHAILCDFNVHPDFQRIGLGTIILEERMRIINELKIPYVYTTLSDDNPLVGMYKKFGFINTDASYFRDSSQNC